MAQSKINSTKKIGLGTTEKLLVPKFIELLWEYPCLSPQMPPTEQIFMLHGSTRKCLQVCQILTS